jgi:hypothetical protein
MDENYFNMQYSNGRWELRAAVFLASPLSLWFESVSINLATARK